MGPMALGTARRCLHGRVMPRFASTAATGVVLVLGGLLAGLGSGTRSVAFVEGDAGVGPLLGAALAGLVYLLLQDRIADDLDQFAQVVPVWRQMKVFTLRVDWKKEGFMT